jgi:uncharacterized protein YkwD
MRSVFSSIIVPCLLLMACDGSPIREEAENAEEQSLEGKGHPLQDNEKLAESLAPPRQEEKDKAPAFSLSDPEQTLSQSLPSSEKISAPEKGEPDALEKDVAQLVNVARAAKALGALIFDPQASAVARTHSQDMCHRKYFSHTTPEGKQPWDRLRSAGVPFGAAGENIAMGQRTPGAVHAAWMNSSGHQANILNSLWTHVGVGYVLCRDSLYWTQVFLRK